MIPNSDLRISFASSLTQHPTTEGRAALRCAYGDSAVICDMVAKVLRENGRRGRHILKRAQEDAALATQIGTLIWEYRDTVKVPRITDEARETA